LYIAKAKPGTNVFNELFEELNYSDMEKDIKYYIQIGDNNSKFFFSGEFVFKNFINLSELRRKKLIELSKKS